MKKFTYVEEYIEFIAGIRDADGKIITRFLNESPLSLARYDVKFIDGVGQQVCSDALTDRQADLALKIISKYQRQLGTLGVDTGTIVDSPQYRLPIRSIDRSRSLSIVDDQIHVRFPYNEKMVKEFKDGYKETQGTAQFNRDLKVWQLALTEYNLNYALTFAENYEFEISDRARELMQLILLCEQKEYRIELSMADDQLVISNAAPELLRYVNEQLGGFALDNLIRLVDHAKTLGITVDSTLEQAIVEQSNARVYNLMINRDSKLNAQDSAKSEQSFEDVVRYATLVNRWPIYLYEPSLQGSLLALARRYFTSADILEVVNGLPADLGQARVIYINKYQSRWQLDIPLLVTNSGMLFGGEKQMLLNSAKKVVYLAHEVYNHSHRGADTIAS